MTEQLDYEDIDTGSEIPELVKRPTTRQLVMWAGASGDLNPIHYDKDYALERGLPGVVVHGQLAGCFLGQMMTDWIGERGSLKKLNVSYKGLNFPGQTLTCKGVVIRKYVEQGEHCVAARIWAENPKGDKTVSGTATVSLLAGGTIS